tara:strand:- start:131934 stop:132602 length:669 start_codon:yes stop_codon:yes gene_type:complete
MQELARIRAVPDQHYALPIVVCPNCSTACVRTKHPDQEFWRGVRSLIRSLRVLIVQLILIALLPLLMLLSIGTAINMMEASPLRTSGLIKMPSIIASDPYGVSTACVLAILCVCIIRLSLHHLRAWAALGVLWGAVGLWTIGFLSPTLFKITLESIFGYELTTARWNPQDIKTASLGFALIFAVSLLGLVPGAYYYSSATRGPQARYRKIRRRIRRRRTRES